MSDYHVLSIPGTLVHQPADLDMLPCLNDDVIAWCIEHIGSGWKFIFNPFNEAIFNVHFTHAKDLIHFKMRWL